MLSTEATGRGTSLFSHMHSDLFVRLFYPIQPVRARENENDVKNVQRLLLDISSVRMPSLFRLL
jgi:hypothetical protein